MMLLGMALYRLGFLSGKRTKKEYLRFTIIGFSIGLAVNGFELYQGIVNDFDALVVSGYFKEPIILEELVWRLVGLEQSCSSVKRMY